MEREGSFRCEHVPAEELPFFGVPLLTSYSFLSLIHSFGTLKDKRKWKESLAYGHTHSRVTSFIHPSSHANLPLILFCLVIRLQRFLSQLFLLFLSQDHKVSNCWDPPASCDLHQHGQALMHQGHTDLMCVFLSMLHID